jgi:hypothetical protein
MTAKDKKPRMEVTAYNELCAKMKVVTGPHKPHNPQKGDLWESKGEMWFYDGRKWRK